ncbi:MAG TPA: nuclear transport factor 2 family protein [Edaphobacter sp.]|jgi:ketosteroid isomerase-like protein|nr:nuclear transport factor 2 family protein [Edaphobacter sp.]
MPNSDRSISMTDESQIREIIQRWSKAVRDENFEAIRADHDPAILMFDVPPPFLSRGIDAYMDTWKTFYAFAPRPVKFDFDDIQIHTGSDVAFATASGHCRNIEPNGQIIPLDFRLTMGFRKVDGRWRIVHEHHSLPAA